MKRYEEEVLVFGSPTIMVTVITELAILHIFNLVGESKKKKKSWFGVHKIRPIDVADYSLLATCHDQYTSVPSTLHLQWLGLYIILSFVQICCFSFTNLFDTYNLVAMHLMYDYSNIGITTSLQHNKGINNVFLDLEFITLDQLILHVILSLLLVMINIPMYHPQFCSNLSF